MAKRGRRRKYKLKGEACPNPECSLYGKPGKANIVSNGAYPTKEGPPARQFLCIQCGQSFCNRAGTMFYDLRSPEERVLMAIKLLVKGMPLCGVAEVLEVKLDTVRHWLRVAAEQSEKVYALLMRELKVSQVELDALWSFVKKTCFARERSFGGRSLDRHCLCQRISFDAFFHDRWPGILAGSAPGGPNGRSPSGRKLGYLGERRDECLWGGPQGSALCPADLHPNGKKSTFEINSLRVQN